MSFRASKKKDDVACHTWRSVSAFDAVHRAESKLRNFAARKSALESATARIALFVVLFREPRRDVTQGPRRCGEASAADHPAARLRPEAESDPLSIAAIAMRARLWALLRGAARAETHCSSAVRLSIPPTSGPSGPGCARVHLPAHRSPWVAAVRAAAARHLHATSAPSSMFDAFKSALFGAGASFAIPDAFSLDDLASLSRKVRDERAARGDDADAANGADAGPLATLGLTPDQIDAIVRALTDEERARPGVLRPPEHRRVAARANALLVSASSQSSEASALSVTASDVASAIQHAAMLAVVMRRVKKALANGAAAPTSWEQFAALVERSQAEATKEELREDARSMDGAFPATRPCPCRSGRKYKTCCSPHRGGNGR